MLQRYRDWQNERCIRRLADKLKAANAAGDRVMARLYWRLMVDAINARSAGQVARMESRMDFQPRRTIKRHVMSAFLRGFLPSSFVTAVFRLLRLRSL